MTYFVLYQIRHMFATRSAAQLGNGRFWNHGSGKNFIIGSLYFDLYRLNYPMLGSAGIDYLIIRWLASSGNILIKHHSVWLRFPVIFPSFPQPTWKLSQFYDSVLRITIIGSILTLTNLTLSQMNLYTRQLLLWLRLLSQYSLSHLKAFLGKSFTPSYLCIYIIF